MRDWHTDGSIEADSRYPRWLKWLWRNCPALAVHVARIWEWFRA